MGWGFPAIKEVNDTFVIKPIESRLEHTNSIVHTKCIYKSQQFQILRDNSTPITYQMKKRKKKTTSGS